MSTLNRPEIVALLDELFADAERADAPVMARLHAMAPEARSKLFQEPRALYGEAREAYLSVSREGGRLLYLLARARGAKRIVEFGTSFGISTIFLAAALRDEGGGKLVTSEFEPTKVERARGNLERAGLSDLVEFRLGDAMETLVEVDGPIDLLYLDGAKTLYRPVLDLLEPRLADRAIVAADNIDMAGLVDDYTSKVRDPAGVYLSQRVVVGDGMEVSLFSR